MSEWFRKPGTTIFGEEPRKLTQHQIKDIVSGIPIVQSPDKNILSRFANEDIASILAYFLEKVKICPDEESLDKLKRILVDKFEVARIQPGAAVGLWLMEAIGQPATQMTLNTFHTAGAGANVGAGIKTYRELLFATLNRSSLITTIHFKKRHLTYQDVSGMKQYIANVTAGDLIDKYVIESPNPDDLEQYWWHTIQPLVSGKRMPQSQKVLRLFLKTALMYEMRITMEDLAFAIENASKDKFSLVVCFHGTLSDGIMDIYPDENFINETIQNKELLPGPIPSHVFIFSIVLPCLNKVQIKGIPGVKRLTPMVQSVWSIVRRERRVPREEYEKYRLRLGFPDGSSGRAWYIHLDQNLNANGISVDNLYQLLYAMGVKEGNKDIIDEKGRTTRQPAEIGSIAAKKVSFYSPSQFPNRGFEFTNIDNVKKVCNIPYSRNTPESLFVILPPEADESRTPGEYLLSLLEAENKKQEDIQKEELKKNRIGFVGERSKLVSVSEYICAVAEGSNLKEIFNNEYVDPTLSYTNDFREIARTLGIEAARNYFTYELDEVIRKTGTIINPRHIELAGDFMTSRGIFLGMNFVGVNKGEAAGHLSLATIEKSMGVFASSAAFGISENLESVSGSIIVGKRPFIGTSASDVLTDEVMARKLTFEVEKKRQEDPNYKIPASIVNDNLNEYDDDDDNIAIIPLDYAEGERSADRSNLMPNAENLVDTAAAREVKTQMVRDLKTPRSITPRFETPLSKNLTDVLAGFTFKIPSMTDIPATSVVPTSRSLATPITSGILPMTSFSALTVQEDNLGIPADLIEDIGSLPEVETARPIEIEYKVPGTQTKVPLVTNNYDEPIRISDRNLEIDSQRESQREFRDENLLVNGEYPLDEGFFIDENEFLESIKGMKKEEK